MAENTETREEILTQVLADLVEECDGLPAFEIDNPAANAALYWAKAVLNPERYSKDHPTVAGYLAPLLQKGPVSHA